MTLAANVTAKKGDTILEVFPNGTIREIAVVSWGKKRATLIKKSSIGTSTEDWGKYNVVLKNGELLGGPIENRNNVSYYKNI